MKIRIETLNKKVLHEIECKTEKMFLNMIEDYPMNSIHFIKGYEWEVRAVSKIDSLFIVSVS